MFEYINYETVRLILAFILTIPYLYLAYIKKVKYELLLNILFWGTILISCFIPFDKYFIKSKSLLECFHYYDNELVKVLNVDDDNALIVNRKSKQYLNVKHFQKKDGYWYYINDLKSINYGDIKIYKKKIKSNKYIVFMYYDSLINYNISDNMDGIFTNGTLKYSSYVMNYKLKTINDIKKYYLIIDKEKVKI